MWRQLDVAAQPVGAGAPNDSLPGNCAGCSLDLVFRQGSGRAIGCRRSNYGPTIVLSCCSGALRPSSCRRTRCSASRETGTRGSRSTGLMSGGILAGLQALHGQGQWLLRQRQVPQLQPSQRPPARRQGQRPHRRCRPGPLKQPHRRRRLQEVPVGCRQPHLQSRHLAQATQSPTDDRHRCGLVVDPWRRCGSVTRRNHLTSSYAVNARDGSHSGWYDCSSSIAGADRSATCAAAAGNVIRVDTG